MNSLIKIVNLSTFDGAIKIIDGRFSQKYSHLNLPKNSY